MGRRVNRTDKWLKESRLQPQNTPESPLEGRGQQKNAYIQQRSDLGSTQEGMEGLQDRKGPARHWTHERIRDKNQDPPDPARCSSSIVPRFGSLEERQLSLLFFSSLRFRSRSRLRVPSLYGRGCPPRFALASRASLTFCTDRRSAPEGDTGESFACPSP